MSLLKTLAWIAALSYSAQTLACDLHGSTGIAQENDLYISVDDKSAGGITESQFTNIINKVEDAYSDVVADEGATLYIERKWDDGTVNAYARQIEEDGEKIYMVSMFGGLARHETITEDGFSLVVCHELGHHLGGAPQKSRQGSTWASNEGQSDYWGTMKCLRKVWSKENNAQVVKKLKIDAEVASRCKTTYRDSNDRAVCMRAAMAGKSLASLFNSLRRITTPVDFSDPITTEVVSTNNSHPMPQCRLDTYFRASLCTVSEYVDVSDSDATVGTCTRENGQRNGSRPLCWYKPAN